MCYPIGSMYAIYANIGGILMVHVSIYIAYMDPMGISISFQPKLQDPLEETQETQEPMEVSQASVLVPAMTLER